jgi:ribonuclease P protein component
MLPKNNRIRKKKDFEKIFKNSKNFKNSIFILKAVKNDLGLNRFGFVISQKVSKKAVVRNKVRRRLTEIMKIEINNIFLGTQIKNGVDLVLIGLPGIEKKEFFEMKEAIREALIKTKLVE